MPPATASTPSCGSAGARMYPAASCAESSTSIPCSSSAQAWSDDRRRPRRGGSARAQNLVRPPLLGDPARHRLRRAARPLLVGGLAALDPLVLHGRARARADLARDRGDRPRRPARRAVLLADALHLADRAGV